MQEHIEFTRSRPTCQAGQPGPSRRELSNAYFLAEFSLDTAENEPCQVCPIEQCGTLPRPTCEAGQPGPSRRAGAPGPAAAPGRRPRAGRSGGAWPRAGARGAPRGPVFFTEIHSNSVRLLDRNIDRLVRNSF